MKTDFAKCFSRKKKIHHVVSKVFSQHDSLAKDSIKYANGHGPMDSCYTFCSQYIKLANMILVIKIIAIIIIL